MDLELTGCVALVAGSSAGVGRAVAARLAAEGCSVLIHGRHQESADEAAADIPKDGGSATVVLGDLTDPEQVARVASLAREHRVDILVNNAGPFVEHDWDGANPADWDAAFQANVMSAVRLTQALTPGMRECGWGCVINIGSRSHLASGGTEGHESNGVYTLVLATTGRRTGEPRRTCLIQGTQGDDFVVVVASKGGADQDPDWFQNLRSDRSVGVQVGTRRFTARARVASSAEREALWPRWPASFPLYNEYAQKTDRVIPIVLLTPQD